MKFNKKNHIQTKNNHPDDEGLAMYADALRLGTQSRLPENILVHVENCTECKKKILFIKKVSEDEYRLNNTINKFSIDKSKGRSRHLVNQLKIASVFLIFLGLSAAFYYFFKIQTSKHNEIILKGLTDTVIPDKQIVIKNNAIPETKKITFSDTIPAKRTKKDEPGLIADNYKKSVFFESIISSNYRSADMEVIEPKIASTYSFNDSVLFIIKGEITDPLIIKIYNNTGTKIHQLNDIKATGFYLNKKLTPGLYYWKLVNEGELIKAGKIEIY